MNEDFLSELALLEASRLQRLAWASMCYNLAALDTTDDTATPCHIASDTPTWYGDDTAIVPQETYR